MNDATYESLIARSKLTRDTSFLLVWGNDPVSRLLRDDRFPFLRIVSVHSKGSAHERLLTVPYDARFSSEVKAFLFQNISLPRTFRIWPPLDVSPESEPIFLAALRQFQDVMSVSQTMEGSTVEDQFLGFQNVLQSLPRALVNPGVAALKDCAEGETIFCCAAGPSMDFAWDFLRDFMPHYRTIAADTLAKPMSERHLHPDFYSAIERDALVVSFFKNLQIDSNSVLVSSLYVPPETFDIFPGTSLFFAPAMPYASALGLSDLGSLHAGSSVGPLNVALALWMGAKRIILIGQDLAFGVHRLSSHMAGTIERERERPLHQSELQKLATGGDVPRQDDSGVVPTTREWNLFRFQIESLISEHPQVEFINTSPAGAKISGAGFSSLESLRGTLVTAQHSRRRRPVLAETSRVPPRPLTFAVHDLERAERAALELLRDVKEGARPPEDLWSALVGFKKLFIHQNQSVYQFAIGVLFPEYIRLEREMNQLQMLGREAGELVAAHQRYLELWISWLPRIRERLIEADETLTKSAERALATNTI